MTDFTVPLSSTSRRRLRSRRRASHLVALLFLLPLGLRSARAREPVVMLPVPPDPCWSSVVLLGWAPELEHFEVAGGGVDLYWDPSTPSPITLRNTKPLAFIVNGNGYDLDDYEGLARHLVRSGFLVAVAQRPAGVDPTDFTLEALAAALDHAGQRIWTPVALIGHSVGGGVVVDAAVRNQQEELGFAIRSVVGLAPNVGFVEEHLEVADAPAYLLIYGSQDQDVHGFTAEPDDAFAAYDLAGSEGSTTCHGAWCFLTPGLDRTMIFVHGADHSGLINQPASCMYSYSCEHPYNDFLSTADQFCIAKGYTEAFLQWTLVEDPIYHRMVRGRYTPPSIQDIVSAEADELGNPAGSPLRMLFQVSPAKRSVIEDFEDGAWNVATATPDVMTALLENGEHLGDSVNIRHATRALLVSWPEEASWQLIGFQVPAGRRNVTGFSHVSLRAGQVSSLTTAEYENPWNTSQSVMLGLHDGSRTSWRWLDPIPAGDRRPDDKTHSVMATYSELLSGFSNIDKTNIVGVYLAFPGGSQGTLMIDSLEWFKD